MLARKDTVVKQNNDGILYLFKKNKVAFFHGRGSFVKAADGGYEIAVAGASPRRWSRKHVIVATGSEPARAARRGRSTKSASSATTARCAFWRCRRRSASSAPA